MELEPQSSGARLSLRPAAAPGPKGVCLPLVPKSHTAGLWAKSALSQPGQFWEQADTHSTEDEKVPGPMPPRKLGAVSDSRVSLEGSGEMVAEACTSGLCLGPPQMQFPTKTVPRAQGHGVLQTSVKRPFSDDCYDHFCPHLLVHVSFSGVYTWRGLLGSGVHACERSRGAPRYFPKWLNQVTCHQQCRSGPSLTALEMTRFLEVHMLHFILYLSNLSNKECKEETKMLLCPVHMGI